MRYAGLHCSVVVGNRPSFGRSRAREECAILFSLRTKILVAILATVVVSNGLTMWVVHDRLLAGARREAARQAYAQAAQVRALYNQRIATLTAEGEAISLYPAVISAIADGNVMPLRQWSAEVAKIQGIGVTLTDATGRVIVRGHAPQQAGDDLTPNLEGLRLALAGQQASGTEEGDELGLALRGYAPVLRNSVVVGAVMIADPLHDEQLQRLVDSNGDLQMRVEPDAVGRAEGCDAPVGASATCRFPLISPSGRTVSMFALTVPLADIARASADAQRTLWLIGAAVLMAGALAAWLLARSLSQPLARLTVAARHVANGDYDRLVAMQSRDEIGELARTFDAMRREVARSVDALRYERDMRDAVLESAGDGMLMVDNAGASLIANDRWRALLGGAGLGAAAHLERVAGGGETFADAASAWLADRGRVGRADFERFGPYLRLRCYTAPVHDRAGAVLGRIFVLRDVTQESEAERMRSALVATVSHELRSPLTIIAGYTDTLLNGDAWDRDMQRDLLEIVARSAATLAGLVDNLLDAAQMEAGILPLSREPVRVERIAQRLVAQRRALTPNHTLVVEAEPALPLADADPQRTEQVLANLVDNAIKYSPPGGPVTIQITTGTDRTLIASVSDCGIGIAPEHVTHLFERFYRAENARATKGVGLGLFICKNIVEAQGGRISVTSALGVGTTFTFTLPQLVDVDADDAIAEAAAERKSMRLRALLSKGAIEPAFLDPHRGRRSIDRASRAVASRTGRVPYSQRGDRPGSARSRHRCGAGSRHPRPHAPDGGRLCGLRADPCVLPRARGHAHGKRRASG